MIEGLSWTRVPEILDRLALERPPTDREPGIEG
jgi:hypothetical protein